MEYCMIIVVRLILMLGLADGFHTKLCSYPCSCAVRELDCVAGVTMVKDGCDCCYMCARQQGDLCNIKDKCDVKRELYCDMTTAPHGPGTGVCRAKSRKPCVIGDKSYADGQKFQLPGDCSKLCTCQNGNYGCAELCPDQYRTPSHQHCRRPRLMKVAGQCCKQWTCNPVQPPKITTSGIKPRHLISSRRKTKSFLYQKPSAESAYQNTEPYCPPSQTAWGRCSRSCDVGVSTRTITDRSCSTHQETRLCFFRPCNQTLGPPRSERCTPTLRLPHKQRVRYEDCVSVHELNLKVCSTCKASRCCYPRREKTKHVDFECGDGRRQLFAFMWIKSCRCDRKCYEKDDDDKGWGKL